MYFFSLSNIIVFVTFISCWFFICIVVHQFMKVKKEKKKKKDNCIYIYIFVSLPAPPPPPPLQVLQQMNSASVKTGHVLT